MHCPSSCIAIVEVAGVIEVAQAIASIAVVAIVARACWRGLCRLLWAPLGSTSPFPGKLSYYMSIVKMMMLNSTKNYDN